MIWIARCPSWRNKVSDNWRVCRCTLFILFSFTDQPHFFAFGSESCFTQGPPKWSKPEKKYLNQKAYVLKKGIDINQDKICHATSKSFHGSSIQTKYVISENKLLYFSNWETRIYTLSLALFLGSKTYRSPCTGKKIATNTFKRWFWVAKWLS